MQLDLRCAGIKQRALVITFELAPDRRGRRAGKRADRTPEIIAPSSCALDAFKYEVE
jgi:hypothetical protein